MKRKRNLKVGDGFLPLGSARTLDPARPDGGLLALEVGTTGRVRQALSSG
jgi:hypothetical protein